MTEALLDGNAVALEWDLADRLRKALRVSGVGVQEMADELGVERNTVGNYIGGRTVPARAALVVWALKTGVPLAWLANEESPRPVGGGSLFLPAERGSDMLRGCRDSNPRPSDLQSVSVPEPVATVTHIKEYLERTRGADETREAVGA